MKRSEVLAKYEGWTWTDAECDVIEATTHLMCNTEITVVSKLIASVMNDEFDENIGG